ncbi:MAG: helix-turn-helix domain-containing protein [Burkholderiales bacterium]|nr:helix-turn-helix domain-containing protein [Burkholderiales bacterium]
MPIEITNPEALGRLIKAARMSQGMTRDEVYLATSLSPKFISEAEAGKETAQIGKILSLLNELGIRLVADAGDIGELLSELESGKKKRLRK